MPDKSEIPEMMVFLFGEAAEAVQRVAPQRLTRWCQAFEDWLDTRHTSASSWKHSRMAWKRLLGERRKPPYELEPADFEAHAAWMSAQGFAPATIAVTLSCASSFYRWCQEAGVDGTQPVPNPAAGVKRPARPHFRQGDGSPVPVLTREEVQALLGLMRRDETPLGRRDTAFLLARLSLGVPLAWLRKLRWEQIEVVAGEVRLHWDAPSTSALVDAPRIPPELCPDLHPELYPDLHPELCPDLHPELYPELYPDLHPELYPDLHPDLHPELYPDLHPELYPDLHPERSRRMPQDVWKAIQAYLVASGRLESIQPQDFVFAPLRSPGRVVGDEQASAWDPRRTLSHHALLGSLKLYGRAVGIAEARLTMHTLRRTAAVARLEAGETSEGMQAFLGSRTVKKALKYRMKRLQEAALEGESQAGELKVDPPLPDRRPHHIQPWEGLRHGMFAAKIPRELVQAVLAENIQGVEEEILGFRALMRELLGLLEVECRMDESRDLGEAYTLAAVRLANLFKVEQTLKKPERETDESDPRQVLLDMAAREMQDEQGEGLDATMRRLQEEIAATRWVLRNTLDLAALVSSQGEVREFIHLVDIYSQACNRLVRLLQAGTAVQGQAEAYLQRVIEQAIREVTAEWNLAELYGR